MVEIGKTYRVKRSVEEYFKVIKIDGKRLMGNYIGREYIGLCPIIEDYLLEEVKTVDVFQYWFNIRFNNLEKLLNEQQKYLESKYYKDSFKLFTYDLVSSPGFYEAHI